MPPGCLDKPVRHFDGRHGWLQMDCNHPDMFTQFVAGTVSRCGFPHHCAWKWEQGSTRSSKTPWLFPRNEAGQVFYGFNLVDGCGFMRLS